MRRARPPSRLVLVLGVHVERDGRGGEGRHEDHDAEHEVRGVEVEGGAEADVARLELQAIDEELRRQRRGVRETG